jgi:hypothetical protein
MNVMAWARSTNAMAFNSVTRFVSIAIIAMTVQAFFISPPLVQTVFAQSAREVQTLNGKVKELRQAGSYAEAIPLAAAIGATVITAGAASPLLAGLISGAVTGGLGSALYGGSLNDVLSASLKIADGFLAAGFVFPNRDFRFFFSPLGMRRTPTSLDCFKASNATFSASDSGGFGALSLGGVRVDHFLNHEGFPRADDGTSPREWPFRQEGAFAASEG